MRGRTWLALVALLVGTCAEPAFASDPAHASGSGASSEGAKPEQPPVCVPREALEEAVACLEREEAGAELADTVLRIDLDACREHRQVDAELAAARVAALEQQLEGARSLTEDLAAEAEPPAWYEHPAVWGGVGLAVGVVVGVVVVVEVGR